MFGLSEEEISIIKSIFIKYSEVSKVLIFGSRVKNTFTERSDIDLVIVEKVDNKVLTQILNDFDESSLIYKVDLKCLSDIKSVELTNHINRLGQVIFEK